MLMESLVTDSLYRIQAVSKLTGVPPATLRAWERRYGFPSPERTESSYRLYSNTQVRLIKQLKALCQQGLAPSEAVKLLKNDEVNDLLHKSSTQAKTVPHYNCLLYTSPSPRD